MTPDCLKFLQRLSTAVLPIPTRTAQQIQDGVGVNVKAKMLMIPIPVVRQIALEKCEGDYIAEGETMRESFPELVWSQSGKPTKVCLGPRGQREDWDRFKSVCPSIVEAVEQLLHSFSDQKVEVTFGDVLPQSPSLGCHFSFQELRSPISAQCIALL
eukprot:g15674.t1